MKGNHKELEREAVLFVVLSALLRCVFAPAHSHTSMTQARAQDQEREERRFGDGKGERMKTVWETGLRKRETLFVVQNDLGVPLTKRGVLPFLNDFLCTSRLVALIIKV